MWVWLVDTLFSMPSSYSTSWIQFHSVSSIFHSMFHMHTVAVTVLSSMFFVLCLMSQVTRFNDSEEVEKGFVVMSQGFNEHLALRMYPLLTGHSTECFQLPEEQWKQWKHRVSLVSAAQWSAASGSEQKLQLVCTELWTWTSSVSSAWTELGTRCF